MQNQERRGPAPIQDALRVFLRDAGLGRRRRDDDVFRAWKAVLGPERARRAVPVRFRSGELVVEVDSSVHLQELANFTGERYRRRVNETLNDERVRTIAFKLRA